MTHMCVRQQSTSSRNKANITRMTRDVFVADVRPYGVTFDCGGVAHADVRETFVCDAVAEQMVRTVTL